MRYYHKLNLNPRLRNTDDCIIRSIVLVTKMSWKDVYSDLAERGKNESLSMNDPLILRPYLEYLGFNRVTRWKRRMNMKDVVDFCRYNNVNAVCFNAEHCVGIYNGQLHDTWNSLCSLAREIYVYGKNPKELDYDCIKEQKNEYRRSNKV